MYATDGKIGVDLSTVSSADGYTGGHTPATLGEQITGDGDSSWLFICAAAALSKGDCVVVNSSYYANPITDALAKAPSIIAFAQTAFAVSQYGFVARKGNGLSIRVKDAAVTPLVPLYTTNTSGALGTATNSASAVQIWGVGLTVTASGTAAQAGTGFISFPTARYPA